MMDEHLNINERVRRATEAVLLGQLDQFNDHNTRTSVSNALENTLMSMVMDDSIHAFDVVCDETNNSPEVVDQRRLNVDVYVQPQVAVEFIHFNASIGGNGSSWHDAIAMLFTCEGDRYRHRLGL